MAKVPTGFATVMKQAQALQGKLSKLQEELEQKRVEGTAGGGMVTVVANGKQEILEVKIDPQVVNPEDVEMLEDLIVAAVNQARQRAQELAEEEMQKLTGGLVPQLLGNIKIPGLT
ncbi:MAG: YbaB/EbfC family nucleoid-associated protein [Candidatus Latescibacterota bacterium]|nr:MAG: YbaB/EbfC family nucleoid-associated protein [Candidatus Latescibacterota bacterium]RKY73059.1 MAG: YbaB/EbfC family nucleoid-associated protein [Candidatus Latescibacterota bacterium]